MKSEINTPTAIPIMVVHTATACTWELKKCRPSFKPKATDHPLCFVPRKVRDTFTVKGIRLKLDYGVIHTTDGRILRDRFMGLRTEQDVTAFLREFGCFTPMYDVERKWGWQLTEILGLQPIFGELANRSPETWYGIGQPATSSDSWISPGWLHDLLTNTQRTIVFEWSGSQKDEWHGAKHRAVIKTADVVSAIVATIQVDHLRGAKFGLCARPDCPRFFEKVSNHNKIYCTQKCGHLVSVRNTRERQRSARAKASLKKASKKAGTKKPPLKIAPKQP